jgi:hypothetical protein
VSKKRRKVWRKKPLAALPTSLPSSWTRQRIQPWEKPPDSEWFNYSKAFGMIPLVIQDLYLRTHLAGFSCRVVRRGLEAIWYGNLQPSSDAGRYKIALWYRLGETPKVWIRSPILSKETPQLCENGSLDLTLEGVEDWRPNQLIVETILPWTTNWLASYERWLVNGQWSHPATPLSTLWLGPPGNRAMAR